jgi:hypothetical protein
MRRKTGVDAREIARFLDSCRTKRHEVTYEALSAVTESEAVELVAAVGELEATVRAWLRSR